MTLPSSHSSSGSSISPSPQHWPHAVVDVVDTSVEPVEDVVVAAAVVLVAELDELLTVAEVGELPMVVAAPDPVSEVTDGSDVAS